MTNRTRLFLFSYFLLQVVTAIAAITWLVSIPSDAQNAILFGLTKSRLMIAGMLFFVATFFTLLAVFAWLRPEKVLQWLEEKLSTQRFLVLSAITSGIVFCATGTLLSIPDKYLGELWAIEERLRPLLVWGLLVSLQSLLGLIGWQVSKQAMSKVSTKNIPIIGGFVLGILVAIWALIAITRMGLSGGNSYWSKIGVPVLWPQVFLALVIALAFQFFLARSKTTSAKQIWLDTSLCMLIWLAAIVLWNNQSYVQGVFNTPAQPPTNEIYPINDSFVYDMAAQKILVGREMDSNVQDKPIFIAYLSIMHALAGASFSNFYLFQILSFAFIPVCGYFIGKSLHSRPLGTMFAILLVIQEQNAIALTNYIHVSTSKMILSEMLTTLGILLCTLLLMRWLKSPAITNLNLWRAGGMLGLTSLVRLNAISILPAAILLIGLAVNFKWKRWITASALISVFVLISVIPWLARTTVKSSNPLSFITTKTNGVIVNQRYNPMINQNTPPANDPNTPAQPPASKLKNYLGIGQGIVTNYMHNLIGITLMLPPSLELYKLLDLVRLPYWNMDWDGSLLPGAFWIILGILALTALGIASTWTRWRAAGLVPLAVILGYNLTTAISLTSGGRYLVPMAWGVLLYFSIGLLESALWLLGLFGWPIRDEAAIVQTMVPENGKFFPQLLVTGLIFLALGAAPVLVETLSPTPYPNTVSVADLAKANQSIPEFSSLGMAENIAKLSLEPLAKTVYGRALYPRYYGENKGDGFTLEQEPLIGTTNFDRLTFFLLSSSLDMPVVLPISGKLSPIIAGADAWAIGCQRTNYFEAVLVVFRAKDTVKVYQQEPFKTTCQ
jgi:hypothetical protein